MIHIKATVACPGKSVVKVRNFLDTQQSKIHGIFLNSLQTSEAEEVILSTHIIPGRDVRMSQDLPNLLFEVFENGYWTDSQPTTGRRSDEIRDAILRLSGASNIYFGVVRWCAPGDEAFNHINNTH